MTLKARWRALLDEAVPGEAIDGPKAKYFRARQLQAVRRLFPLVILGNVFNTVAVLTHFGDRLPMLWLGLWATVAVAGLGVGYLWWGALIKEQGRPAASPAAMRLIVWHVAFYTLVWSAVPVLVFPGADHNGEMLLATVTVGMLCAGGFLLSAHVLAASAYIVILTAASVSALLRSTYGQYPMLMLLLLAYGSTILGMVWSSSRVFLSRLRAEAETERQAQLIDLLLRDFEEHASDWLWETQPHGHLRHVSRHLASTFGMSAEQLQQRPFVELLATLIPADHVEARDAHAHLSQCLLRGVAFRDLELPVLVGDDLRWWSLTAKPLFDEQGRASGWRGVGRDITSARRARDDLARLANFDSLTGLANRHRFGEALSRMTQTGSPESRRCALMFLDLDNFKNINDSLGHAVGDLLLRSVGERIRQCVDESVLLARLGGDEFALLMPHPASVQAVAELAERLLASMNEPCQLDDVRVDVRASMGIALCPIDGDDPETLLKCADLALYAAKAAGRNTWRMFDAAMAESARNRVRLQHELGEALASEQFTIYYQPQWHLGEQAVVGFEALVRWHHAERGLIGPAEFIPVAEETGQIVPLGTWVLRQACREAAAWPAHLRVSVNLSAVQFRSSAVVEVVMQALADSGLAPERLELEITESALIEDYEGAQATLMALRSRGVRVALDDFGTGYSSLAYLRHFQMDKLKIDGLFVRSLDSDTEAQAVVTAIISLARALHLETTAEGVETRAQKLMLRALGCDDIQGYLVSRPMPAPQIRDFLIRSAHEQVASH
ncbi:MAG TPA: EAL domain-containing protein [Aquabacterium sp.]|uniref:putative bifunctional diguanylate cyclase/phosphodiesterase n=1 Tax=Aquabacterium sp. TaxID=1872578 RepID=UPI002E379CDA|nr:EAL domain-containing protein [Aquabacterium sp.]HEX5372052.1 EAL domain-containing protein [Aquabacterium sp.]